MSIDIDGHAVESLRITHAMGAHWTARVTCEIYTPGATATLDDGTTRWVGRVKYQQVVGDSINLTLTGGAGDWDVDLDPIHWVAPTTVGDVAAALAQSAGATAEPSPVPLPQWRHARSRLASALTILARWGGVEWYQKPDGAIAFDTPLGEALTEPQGDDGETLTYDVGGRLPMLLSAAVGRALYLYEAGAKSWSVTTWPRAPRTPARPGGWVGGYVESQANELVDIRLDDGSTRTGVPLWSCPGVRAKVPNETRVLVFDIGADPRATVAFASQWTADVDELHLADAGGWGLRDGELVTLTDLPVALGGMIPPPLATAGITPAAMMIVKLAPPVMAQAGPPMLGRSKVKL